MSDYTLYIVDVNLTLEQLIDFYYGGNYTVDEILNYQDNKDSIFLMYTDQEKEFYTEGSADFVKQGTSLKIPKNKFKLSLIDEEVTSVPASNINDLQETYWDEVATRYYDQRIIDEFGEAGEVFIKGYKKIYIKIFSRVLKKVINVSQYIKNSSFGNDASGGNFSFSLPAISADYKINEEGEEGWVKTDKDYGDGYYSKTILFKEHNKVNDFYFEKVLNSQDLVIIKTEPFVAGEEEIINFNTIDNYDMIGLIDGVNTSVVQTNQNIGISIDVTGRDLYKILVEDGTYFYPVELVAKNKLTITENPRRTQLDDRVLGRLNDIELSKPITVKELFEYIKSKISFTTCDYSNEKGAFVGNFVQSLGVWNFIKFSYEDAAGERVLFDSSIATMSGSIINFLNTALQEPFTEMITDTYGSEFILMVRTPPISKKLVESNIIVEVSYKYLLQDNTVRSDDDFFSWMSLMPNGLVLGNAELAMLFLPAIYIEKFAKIFGSKRLQYVHNYLYYNKTNIKEEQNKINSRVQAAKDLKFAMEGKLFEPFTKKGTLTFENIRGIKKGIHIHIPEIDMIYYVDGYQHTRDTIEGNMTTIQVSRGTSFSNLKTFYDLVKVNINEEQNEISDVVLDEVILEKLFKKKYD